MHAVYEKSDPARWIGLESICHCLAKTVRSSSELFRKLNFVIVETWTGMNGNRSSTTETSPSAALSLAHSLLLARPSINLIIWEMELGSMLSRNQRQIQAEEGRGNWMDGNKNPSQWLRLLIYKKKKSWMDIIFFCFYTIRKYWTLWINPKRTVSITINPIYLVE